MTNIKVTKKYIPYMADVLFDGTSKYSKIQGLSLRNVAIIMKDFLRKKKIILSFNPHKQKEEYATLRSFGKRILELEKIGYYSAYVITVRNHLTSRPIHSSDRFLKNANGSWSEIEITVNKSKSNRKLEEL